VYDVTERQIVEVVDSANVRGKLFVQTYPFGLRWNSIRDLELIEHSAELLPRDGSVVDVVEVVEERKELHAHFADLEIYRGSTASR